MGDDRGFQKHEPALSLDYFSYDALLAEIRLRRAREDFNTQRSLTAEGSLRSKANKFTKFNQNKQQGLKTDAKKEPTPPHLEATMKLNKLLNDNLVAVASLPPATSSPAPAPTPSPTEPPTEEPAKRLFYCGYQDIGEVAAKTIFADYQVIGSFVQKCRTNGCHAKTNDVLLFGMHGRCGDFKDNHSLLMERFQGKVLFLNGESFGNANQISPESSDRIYQLGPYMEQQSWQKHTMHVYFLVLAFYKLPSDKRQAILDPAKKPRNTGTKPAVAYFASNCVDFRQQAATEIAKILPLHYVKGCRISSNGTMAEMVPKNIGMSGAYANDDIYKDYKYCLVMENTNYPGYITEKILNAYVGGCIPIYYGTTEIFDLFHKDSFIFYNISDPQPALQQLQRLEENAMEYMRMLYKTPVLASPEVLEKYFSLSDDIGGGSLKKRIREMMDIPFSS
ncbi:Glycosyltransferase family 10 (fucosyltransferase) [Seminavis robusta]|uniref:Fucosyltransferase n=1 Tax=Seminavis robusta TaxID=568900 RepID=A0A9N8DZ22_9STRA|nr:Glycosyltransferase family 10 (fucosyltransferase) [Seminavis robusta]|eukprot:Sro355_g125060.1 Glycosyltransferase family 10 (fucosyltransferase) (449) ;mRNA; r:29150-30496